MVASTEEPQKLLSAAEAHSINNCYRLNVRKETALPFRSQCKLCEQQFTWRHALTCSGDICLQNIQALPPEADPISDSFKTFYRLPYADSISLRLFPFHMLPLKNQPDF